LFILTGHCYYPSMCPYYLLDVWNGDNLNMFVLKLISSCSRCLVVVSLKKYYIWVDMLGLVIFYNMITGVVNTFTSSCFRPPSMLGRPCSCCLGIVTCYVFPCWNYFLKYMVEECYRGGINTLSLELFPDLSYMLYFVIIVGCLPYWPLTK
jgi:hypothetical protein